MAKVEKGWCSLSLIGRHWKFYLAIIEEIRAKKDHKMTTWDLKRKNCI